MEFRLNSLEELVADVERDPKVRMASFSGCLLARVLGGHYTMAGFSVPGEAARAVAQKFGMTENEAGWMFWVPSLTTHQMGPFLGRGEFPHDPELVLAELRAFVAAHKAQAIPEVHPTPTEPVESPAEALEEVLA